MSSTLEAKPFPANVIDSLSAGSSAASNAMAITAWHWIMMTINKTADLIAR
ncbi:hypothetical protein QVA66_05060 [Staphylococcus chromogenes]|nr:hypothetical protein [Staphylococcus chromogenes]